MKSILKVLGGLIGLLVLFVLGTFVAARFHDGPMDGGFAIVSGGPFSSGEMHHGPEPDWSFLNDYFSVEFQLLEPDRSRTTYVMEHDNRIFIPSGYMNSLLGKIWKHWPMEAEKDGRAILRVDGKLYERQLVRITDGEILDGVLAELGRKYGGGEPAPRSMVTSNDLWIFELTPR